MEILLLFCKNALKMTIEETQRIHKGLCSLNTIPSWKEEMKGKSQNDGKFLRTFFGRYHSYFVCDLCRTLGDRME